MKERVVDKRYSDEGGRTEGNDVSGSAKTVVENSKSPRASMKNSLVPKMTVTSQYLCYCCFTAYKGRTSPYSLLAAVVKGLLSRRRAPDQHRIPKMRQEALPFQLIEGMTVTTRTTTSKKMTVKKIGKL